MKYVREVFTDQIIDLDGRTFQNCTFIRCTLRYGGGRFRIVGPTTIDPVRLKFVNGVDPDNNDLVYFLRRGQTSARRPPP